jgi:carbon-monoxide dehydrogenase medium subunit
MESAVRPGELAVSATFRRPPAGSGTSFVEVSRRQGDYAVCGVGAVVTQDGERLRTARVALVSVGVGPVLVDVSAALDEGSLDLNRVAELVDTAIDPEADIHASADYRRHLAHVLVRRALGEARHRAERRAAA